MRGRMLGTALAGVLALWASGAQAESWQGALRTEIGGEYDSNVRRTETVDGATGSPPALGSPLLRLVFGAELRRSFGVRHELSLALTSAGKLFATRPAQDENVAVLQGAGRWRSVLGQRTVMVGALGYYDAYQAGREDARDFRSVTPTLQLGQGLGEHLTLVLSAGWRAFTFKPNTALDFRAPTAGLDMRWTHETSDQEAEWELATGGSIEARAFRGVAYQNSCDDASARCGLEPGNSRQQDTFVIGHLELTRTGRFLAGAGYALQWNHSNSFGQSLWRHIATLRLTTPLFLELYLTARVDLVHVTYPDPVLLGATSTASTFLSVEDENRNTFRAELSRALGDHVQVVARYALFRSAISHMSYFRQTLLLSLSINTDLP